ncbi:hypothetical protein J3R30DRAFT_3402232 [Lentinula aciculospora]|uniref:Uncharacterized protein n=1 Tax=Lentinula aciculospora TaxID=153920 RepID=A0A9W9DS54_9AGAR|nr:hypothetical protein J3R30DRAFT_3402232 [Lentinula aciculospora]
MKLFTIICFAAVLVSVTSALPVPLFKRDPRQFPGSSPYTKPHLSHYNSTSNGTSSDPDSGDYNSGSKPYNSYGSPHLSHYNSTNGDADPNESASESFAYPSSTASSNHGGNSESQAEPTTVASTQSTQDLVSVTTTFSVPTPIATATATNVGQAR